MNFDKFPANWTEAPHFGNAMVGSMLYRVDDTIRLQVFRADVHDHRDNTWGWTAFTWALNNCWSQYRYSMDDTMLREKLYPLLRRAINLYLHMVKEGEDGRFHLPPTYSPESGVFADGNSDLARFNPNAEVGVPAGAVGARGPAAERGSVTRSTSPQTRLEKYRCAFCQTTRCGSQTRAPALPRWPWPKPTSAFGFKWGCLRACLNNRSSRRESALTSSLRSGFQTKFEPTHVGCYHRKGLFRHALTLLKTTKRLNIDDPLIPRWKAMVEHLPDYSADELGFMLGRDKSSLANHQHFSNLLMLYPLHLVNIEQEGTADVLKRSLNRARFTAGPGQRQAMVQAHAGPIGTAMGLGDEALDSLKRLQGDLYPNGLWYESPCIGSTLAPANIIQDMLLQSWSDPAKDESGPIRIFPAVPSTWQDVEFHDLRAEGAFLVSAKRSGGQTVWVRIKSLAGEPCRVRPGMDGEIRIKGDREFKLRLRSPGV